MKKTFSILILIVLLLACGSTPFASAGAFEFASDFPVLQDLGGIGYVQRVHGFGGIKKGIPLKKTPVIFVHGNGGNSDNFLALAKLFYQQGYSKQEIWAFSYMGYPSILDTTFVPHEGNVKDLNQFIQAVMEYTGAKKVNLIGHSLGVTLSLYWMKEFNAYDKIDTFVAVAGAIHGFAGMEDIEWSPQWMDAHIRINGDESPYGRNTQEKNHVAPDDTKEIRYVVVELGQDDRIMNSYGPNSLSPFMEGADAVYSLQGKIQTPLMAPMLEKQCGVHCTVILRPEVLFSYLAKHFL